MSSSSSTMALFVPQWPSAAEGNNGDDSNTNTADANDNTAITTETTDTMNGMKMNGTNNSAEESSSSTTSQQQQQQQQQQHPPSADDGLERDDSGGIELTHDPITGSIHVTDSEAEAPTPTTSEEDEADQQCQLWSQTNPPSSEEDSAEMMDEPGGVEVNVTSSPLFGDIWSTEAFGFQTTSPLKDLLDGGDYSLAQLLEQDELLQELRCCEARLVEFFERPEVVAGLVECLMVRVPSYPETDRSGGGGGGAGVDGRGNLSTKQRWCAEETARRALRKAQQQQQQQSPSSSVPQEENKKSSVFDATSPRREDEGPRVEAKWNSPPQKKKGDGIGAAAAAAEPRTAECSWLLGYPDRPARSEGAMQPRPEEEEEEENLKPPEEEYDLRFIRYPYMACEVLCSEVGGSLDVLVDGYIHDDGGVIFDEEDSLLGDTTGEGKAVVAAAGAGGAGAGGGAEYVRQGSKETKDVEAMEEEFDNVNLGDDNINTGTFPPAPPPMPLSPTPVQLAPKVAVPPPQTTPPSSMLQTIPPKQQQQQQPPPPRPKRQRILDILFVTLLTASPASLDDRRAGYFEKVLSVLFRKRSQAMCDYMDNAFVMPQSGAVGNNRTVEMTSYVSFEKQNKSFNDPAVDNDAGNASSGAAMGAMGTTGTEAKPPILMCALFDHLHSYSIMHIVQRLLLPSPTRQAKEEKESTAGAAAATAPENGNAKEEEDQDDDNPNSAMNDQFMNALNQMNGPSDNTNNGMGGMLSSLDDDDDDEEMEEDDPMNHIFQCTWSMATPNFALELLLKRLQGDTSSFLKGYGYNSDVLGFISGGQEGEEAMEDETMVDEECRQEASLLCAQHASEILIVIIQNSPLDSSVMRVLSSEVALSSIIDLIVKDESSSEQFVAHESIMTCTISVLESLVLQLGGYGAVAAVANATTEAAKNTTNGAQSNTLGDKEYNSPANTRALLQHVPRLLNRLSALLTHEATQTWTLPAMQYTTMTTSTTTSPPPIPMLGTSRLRILRLVESFVLLGDSAIDAHLQKSDVLTKAVDLFWQFEWCSMLHQTVANLLVHVFEGGRERSGLQNYFLSEGGAKRGCRLLERLMASFAIDDAAVVAPGEEGNPISSEDATNINEGISDAKEDENDVAATGPRYGEMMLAMKKLYHSNEKGASMESIHGSEDSSGSDNNDEAITIAKEGKGLESNTPEGDIMDDDGTNVAPVSEDDVDSAMEKEDQESGGEEIIGMASKQDDDGGNDNDADEGVAVVTANDDSSSALQQETTHQDESGNVNTKALFRKGYMGHVIIICQALVHACNSNNSDNDADGDPNSANRVTTEEEEAGEYSLSSPRSMDEITDMSGFDSSAALPPQQHHDHDGDAISTCSNNSKKRKDRSPLRDGLQEDIKRLASSPSLDADGECVEHDANGKELFSPTSPIPKVPSSIYSAVLSPEGSVGAEKSQNQSSESLSIDKILRRNPLHDQWQQFVTSVLASEMSVQSTLLGGACHQQQSQQQQQEQMMTGQETIVINDGAGNCSELLQDSDPIVMGEIDMDENDLDIAASMMEALSLPTGATGGSDNGGGPPAGHRRRRDRGVIGGGSNIGGSNFGSVIQQPVGFKDYVYDDPLGGVHPFDSNSSSDEEDENRLSSNRRDSLDDDGFMSDAMVVSKEDGGVTSATKHQQGSDNNGGIKKSGSNSSSDGVGEDDEDDDDEDDDDVPVLDLFAGSFEANFANFDAFDSNCGTTSNTNTNPFEAGDGKEGGSPFVPDDDFFAAINSSSNGGIESGATATESAKAEDDADALFGFSKTPFDLVDTLSSTNDTKNNEGDVTKTAASLFHEGVGTGNI